MRFKNRPSYNETAKKISQAKKALRENQVSFGPNTGKLVDEFTQLKIGDTKEIWELLKDLLEEIEPSHYAGPHPPMLAIEPNIKGSELFIFIWQSKKMQKEMYLKFSIKGDHFFYISLHPSNRSKKCWNLVPNFSPPERGRR